MVIPLRTDDMPILKPDLIVSIRALLAASSRKHNPTGKRPKKKRKKKKEFKVYLTKKSRINLAQLYPEVQYYHGNSMSLHLLTLLSCFLIFCFSFRLSMVAR